MYVSRTTVSKKKCQLTFLFEKPLWSGSPFANGMAPGRNLKYAPKSSCTFGLRGFAWGGHAQVKTPTLKPSSVPFPSLRRRPTLVIFQCRYQGFVNANIKTFFWHWLTALSNRNLVFECKMETTEPLQVINEGWRSYATICRLCLQKDGFMLGIFNNIQGKEKSISKKIVDCTALPVSNERVSIYYRLFRI